MVRKRNYREDSSEPETSTVSDQSDEDFVPDAEKAESAKNKRTKQTRYSLRNRNLGQGSDDSAKFYKEPEEDDGLFDDSDDDYVYKLPETRRRTARRPQKKQTPKIIHNNQVVQKVTILPDVVLVGGTDVVDYENVINQTKINMSESQAKIMEEIQLAEKNNNATSSARQPKQPEDYLHIVKCRRRKDNAVPENVTNNIGNSFDENDWRNECHKNGVTKSVEEDEQKDVFEDKDDDEDCILIEGPKPELIVLDD